MHAIHSPARVITIVATAFSILISLIVVAPDAHALKYKNCKQVRKDYPNGVAYNELIAALATRDGLRLASANRDLNNKISVEWSGKKYKAAFKHNLLIACARKAKQSAPSPVRYAWGDYDYDGEINLYWSAPENQGYAGRTNYIVRGVNTEGLIFSDGRVLYHRNERALNAGDESRPELDPRRNALIIKDLRAFAASVLVDAGATTLEASKLLRHTDPCTTLAHYARAQEEEGFDADRVSLRDETGLRLSERLEKLWEVWAAKFPEAAGKVAAVSAAHASASHVVDLNQRRLRKHAAGTRASRQNSALPALN